MTRAPGAAEQLFATSRDGRRLSLMVQPTTQQKRSSRRAYRRLVCASEKRSTGIFGVKTGYRFYNPDAGRWLNRDPIEETGGVNLILFARNDSVNRVDRDGRIDFRSQPWGRSGGASSSRLPFDYDDCMRRAQNAKTQCQSYTSGMYSIGQGQIAGGNERCIEEGEDLPFPLKLVWEQFVCDAGTGALTTGNRGCAIAGWLICNGFYAQATLACSMGRTYSNGGNPGRF